MIWIRKKKGGAGRFMGNDIPETWSPLDETKLTKSQVNELPNYCEMSETKPASIAEAEKAAELKRKFDAGELVEKQNALPRGKK